MMEKKRKRQIRNINFELPSPIIEVIFSKLLFFNLPNCRIVCKQWNDLILAGPRSPSSFIIVFVQFHHLQRFSLWTSISKMAKKRQRSIRNINSELPSAIIEVIFSKLPFYILPSCRIVCKQWNDLILTRKFDPQISNSSLFYDHACRELLCVDFDPNPLKGMSTVASFNLHPKLFSRDRLFTIFNYCNGLLCILIEKFSGIEFTHCAVWILNPMTNEYLKLPISKAELSDERYYYALGFSPKTKQYKIARASISHELDGTLIEIFAFGKSCEWINVGLLPSLWNSNDFVYSNGGLYLVKDFSFVHRLDVEDETIRAIPSPIDKGIFWQIIDLNGTLYQISCTFDNFFYGWKMREDFSWIKVFAFSASPIKSFHFNIMRAYEDGKILFDYGDYEVMLYDPMTERMEILADQDGEVKKWESFHQMGSPNFNSLHNILAGND